jgi:hypothetical protein
METAVEVEPGGIRLTPGGRAAADLTISDGGDDVKYNVYLRKDDILLQFASADRGRAELAARMLRMAGVVGAEARWRSGRDAWSVEVTTDKLAAGREELRRALAEIVRAALARGWVNRETAERWLRKLERGRTLKEGWPKYGLGLARGALEVRYQTTNASNVEREVKRLREVGLVEGVHFTARMPEGGRDGYVSILKEGLAYAAWLSVHGSGEQQRLAAEFVEYILQRAREEGEEVHEKALEAVRREGRQAP